MTDRHLRPVPPPAAEPDQPPAPRRALPAWRQGPARQQLLNDARFDWTRNRTAQRAITAAYLATITLLATVVLHLDVNAVLSMLSLAVLVPAMICLIGLLNAATRGVMDLKEQYLDERDRMIRERAYRRAYRLVLAAGSIGYALLILASIAGHLPTTPRPWLALAMITFSGLWVLPTATVAWTEQD